MTPASLPFPIDGNSNADGLEYGGEGAAAAEKRGIINSANISFAVGRLQRAVAAGHHPLDGIRTQQPLESPVNGEALTLHLSLRHSERFDPLEDADDPGDKIFVQLPLFHEQRSRCCSRNDGRIIP
ncbi:hypothetical protein [Methylobacterium sp. CM6247]